MSLTPYRRLNNGFSYVVVFIDLYTHKAQARPLKTRMGFEMARVMGEVFNEGSVEE